MNMRNGFCIAAVTLAAGTLGSAGTLRAQASDSAIYARAQELVTNGDATAGRKLIDSVMSASQAGSARYVEALYWRSKLASNVTDAERGYRQIVVDYPLSPRVDDALLRLGQLEQTRGDRDAALQHFQRLLLEHPQSPLRSRASLGIARVYLDKNDVQRGCAANADALAHAPPSDVELRNQIDYQNQRCRGVVLTPATEETAQETPKEVPIDKAPPAVEPPVVTKPAKGVKGAKPAKTPAKVAAKPAPAVTEPAPTPAPEETPEQTEAQPEVPSEPAPTPAKAAPVTKPTAKPVAKPAKGTASPSKGTTGKFSVQIAAYYDKPQADAMAEKLRKRGYDAHVDGTAAPFRVRIGHYATHTQAATALANMKAKKLTGFVADE